MNGDDNGSSPFMPTGREPIYERKTASERARSPDSATVLLLQLSELSRVDTEFELITADPAEDPEDAYGITPAGPRASSCSSSSSSPCCCCL